MSSSRDIRRVRPTLGTMYDRSAFSEQRPSLLITLLCHVSKDGLKCKTNTAAQYGESSFSTSSFSSDSTHKINETEEHKHTRPSAPALEYLRPFATLNSRYRTALTARVTRSEHKELTKNEKATGSGTRMESRSPMKTKTLKCHRSPTRHTERGKDPRWRTKHHKQEKDAHNPRGSRKQPTCMFSRDPRHIHPPFLVACRGEQCRTEACSAS